MRNEKGFLHKNKGQSFLQAGNIVVTGHSQACPKYQRIVFFSIDGRVSDNTHVVSQRNNNSKY